MMKYKRIRSLREEAELTQLQMAKIIHCSQQAYSKYELGDREIPLEKLIILARFHHTSIDYILEVSDKRNVYDHKTINTEQEARIPTVTYLRHRSVY
jgi:transcriptional regulator with XRE-family HTH domain